MKFDFSLFRPVSELGLSGSARLSRADPIVVSWPRHILPANPSVLKVPPRWQHATPQKSASFYGPPRREIIGEQRDCEHGKPQAKYHGALSDWFTFFPGCVAIRSFRNHFVSFRKSGGARYDVPTFTRAPRTSACMHDAPSPRHKNAQNVFCCCWWRLFPTSQRPRQGGFLTHVVPLTNGEYSSREADDARGESNGKVRPGRWAAVYNSRPGNTSLKNK